MKITSRRLLSAAGVLMLLESVLNTAGNVLPPTDPGLIAPEKSMLDYHFDMSMHLQCSMST